MIVVAIVGNAAEHWVAVLVAIKNKMDLSVNIAIGSSAQVALFVAPVLVIASFFLGPGPMPLVFNGFEIAAVIIGVLVAYQVTNEGESNWFEGVQLLALYAILALDVLLRMTALAMELVLLIVSFAVILAGALLFTNAIEWVGHKLGLAEGAVGSLLAAVGTALPETLIAIVALVGATKSEDVAIGAIVGAPFLLATLAMGLVGRTAYLYRRRREQDIELEVHVPTLDRDLAFFGVFFALGLALGFGAPEGPLPGRGRLLPLLRRLRQPSRCAAAARSSPRRA